MAKLLSLLLLLSATAFVLPDGTPYCDELVSGIATYGNITRTNIILLEDRIVGKTCLDQIDAQYASTYQSHVSEDINELNHLYGIAVLQHCDFTKEVIPSVPIVPPACGTLSYCDQLRTGILTYGYITNANVLNIKNRVLNKMCLSKIDEQYVLTYKNHLSQDVNEINKLYKIATMHNCTFATQIVPSVPSIPDACETLVPPPQPSSPPPQPFPPKPSPPLPLPQPPKPSPPSPEPPSPQPPQPLPPQPLPPSPSLSSPLPSPPKASLSPPVPHPPLSSPPAPQPPTPTPQFPQPPTPAPPNPSLSPPLPRPPSPQPPSPPPATPSGEVVCFTGSGGTTGSPYNQISCPSSSCISTLDVTISGFNGEPVFSGFTATCLDVITDSKFNISTQGFDFDSSAPVSSITVLEGPCFTGISGAVVINPGDNGLYVSTLTTDESPPQVLGYISGAPPYDLPTRPLGSVRCGTNNYLTSVYGRSGAIIDEMCFVCGNPFVPASPPPPPPSEPPPPEFESPPPPEICSSSGDVCTSSQICAGKECVSTTVTFYDDVVLVADPVQDDPVFAHAVTQVGDNPVSITPVRCACYELGSNLYSGLSFNFQPSQLATYTGSGCTGYVHIPHVIGYNNTCYNGTIGDPSVISTDIYCDNFFVGESNPYVINDNLLSMLVCDNLLNIPPPSSPEPPPPPPEVQEPSPPPPPPPILYEPGIQLGPGVSYIANSIQLSYNNVYTNVTDINGSLVLTMNFMTNSTTVIADFSQGEQSALDIPEVFGLNINTSTIYVFDLVATYVASQLTFSMIYPNSTAGRRKLLNGLHPDDPNEDHPGCDKFIDTSCTIPCCAQHDKCFHDNNCSAGSAWSDWFHKRPTKCGKCNTDVVGCILTKSLPCAPVCAACIASEDPLLCDLATAPPSGNMNSCYDHKCDEFYDCPEGCPICPIPYLTPSTQNGCCNCASPCSVCTPSCNVPLEFGQDCPSYCAALTQQQCCPGCPNSSPLGGLGCAVCLSLAQAGCGLNCGLCI